jgi:two-component system, OmpR family, alkaline phosphatase synthesis response regulator PhoP
VNTVLCYPSTSAAEVLLAVTESKHAYSCVNNLESADALSSREDIVGAVIDARGDFTEAIALARGLRRREDSISPIIMVLHSDQVNGLEGREELAELTARISGALRRLGRGSGTEIVELGPLTINTETFQATVSGKALDLTFMEYELLRFLSSNPGKVFTRETLLNRVWGYEYYGGARTVDVHVRRLRAKLGESHAHLIQTVRSVGYRMSQQNWNLDN